MEKGNTHQVIKIGIKYISTYTYVYTCMKNNRREDP